MSRDMRDLSPETYVANPDTSSGITSSGTTGFIGNRLYLLAFPVVVGISRWCPTNADKRQRC